MNTQRFGLPDKKKFPMPDRQHVFSAIKFFNYATPSEERRLANAIIARMGDYGISWDDVNVGPTNRFRKYIPKRKQEESISHHGIKGQHWGVKNGPPYPLDRQKELTTYKYANETLKKAKQSNVDRWGKDKDHNILYVTGKSGSGKSTIAKMFAQKEKAEIISLDSYFEPEYDEETGKLVPNKEQETAGQGENKEFNEYLKKNFPDFNYGRVVDSKGNLVPDKEHNKPTIIDYKKIDRFMDLTEAFGRDQFDKKKKVVVEGIQLYDESTYYQRKGFFKDKPTIVTNTSNWKAYAQATRREGKNPFVELIRDYGNYKDYMSWYKESDVQIKDLLKELA